MADNVGYTPGVGAIVAADDIAGVLHQRVKLGIGGDGVAVDLSAANPMPITGALTDAELRATPVPVDGPLTDAELRAAPIEVELVASSLSGPLQVIDTVADESAQNMILLLTRMLNYLNAPMGYDKSLQRQRVTAVVESGTVTTVSTLNDLTRLNNLEAYNARMLVLDNNRVAWAQCVRSRIT